MADINTLVAKNFNENISFFESYHPTLFQSIVSLENAIQNNHYQEKYELIYENKNFDILEKETKTTLYKGKSLKYTSAALKSVNYKLDNNIFETFHKRTISDKALLSYTNEKKFNNHLTGYAPIINYIHNNSVQKKELTNVYKFIFFGVGLGLHIPLIAKKLSAKSYLIIENDLELFRLSLFTTNYKELAEHSSLYFSIFESTTEFSNSITNFLNQNYYQNHYIKFFQMSSHSEDNREQIYRAITSQPHLTFFYHTMLKHFTHPLSYLADNYQLLNQGLDFNSKHIRGKPVLLLAAGPSLEKNKNYLIQNNQYFIIIAVAATLSFLEKENISPDIVIQLDGHSNSVLHFENLHSLDFLEKTSFIFSDKVPLSITNMLNKDNLFFFENSSKYRKNALRAAAPCVGSISLQLLLLLNAREIYLLGLDLAMDAKTGERYISSHAKFQQVLDDKNTNTKDYTQDLIEIEGNYSSIVMTTSHFQASIDIINYSLKTLKNEKQKVINLGDGAKFVETIIQNTNATHLATTIDKEKLSVHLHKLLKKHSSTKVSAFDYKQIYNKLIFAKDLKEMILEYSILQEKEKDTLKKELHKIVSYITSQKNIQEQELSRILENYLKYILPFIFDFFEDNKLTLTHYLAIKKLLTTHILEIIEYYLKKFERYL